MGAQASLQSLSLSLPTHKISVKPTFSLKPIRFTAFSSPSPDPDKHDSETILINNFTSQDEIDDFFNPPTPPEGFVAPPYFDEGPLESEDDVARAYEERYGPGISPKPSFSLKPLRVSAFSSPSPDPKEHDSETILINNFTPEDENHEIEEFFDPPTLLEGFVALLYFDEGPVESEDDVARAYEELYGCGYSGVTLLNNDVKEMDKNKKKMTPFGKEKKEKIRDEFEEREVEIRRVSKAITGGRKVSFRVIMVVGDKQGRVGVGIGKAKYVFDAKEKAAVDARRNIITVPMTKYSTFPHRSDGNYGAAKVMPRPASPGTGVIAGGAVRIVLEMVGVENTLGKQLGSDNPLNNARATVVAILKMRQFSEVAAARGIPMEELWK